MKDQGIGIPADKLPFISDRFFRVQESSQVFSGLGLGLFGLPFKTLNKKSQFFRVEAFFYTVIPIGLFSNHFIEKLKNVATI